MIAWINDVMHLKFTNLCADHDFPFCLKCTNRWSKNTNEERSCPKQVLCQSDNPLISDLLNSGICVDHYAHDESISQVSLIFGGYSSQYNIWRMFELLLSNDEFEEVFRQQEGRFWNHLIRKGACTLHHQVWALKRVCSPPALLEK